VLNHLGTVAAWLSQESNSDVWAIDVEFTIVDPAGGPSEVLSFDRFEPEEFPFTEGEQFDTLAVTGKAPRNPYPQPDDIPGLIAWGSGDYLEGVDGLADTDPVETWTDRSNRGNSPVQATADNRPTLQTNELNGLAVVRFDGTNDSLARIFASVFSQPYSFLLVAKHTAGSVASDENMIGGLDNAAADSGEILATAEAGTDQIAMKAGTEALIGDLSGSAFVLVVAFDGASSVARLDRVQSAESAGTRNLTKFVLGADGAQAAAFSGLDIAEFAVYDRKLSVAQMRALEDYVSEKYAV
jgi:hypothetical protein